MISQSYTNGSRNEQSDNYRLGFLPDHKIAEHIGILGDSGTGDNETDERIPC